MQVRNICSGALTINSDGTFPSNETTVETITGDLTITGGITRAPNFAALRVVEGNLTINNITTAGLTELADIFLLLETVGGDLVITNNANVTTITGFHVLASVGGAFTLTGNTVLTSCCAFFPIANADLTPGGGTTGISGNGAGCINAGAITGWGCLCDTGGYH